MDIDALMERLYKMPSVQPIPELDPEDPMGDLTERIYLRAASSLLRADEPITYEHRYTAIRMAFVIELFGLLAQESGYTIDELTVARRLVFGRALTAFGGWVITPEHDINWPGVIRQGLEEAHRRSVRDGR